MVPSVCNVTRDYINVMSNDLTVHMRTHSGDKPYVYLQCWVTCLKDGNSRDIHFNIVKEKEVKDDEPSESMNDVEAEKENSEGLDVELKMFEHQYDTNLKENDKIAYMNIMKEKEDRKIMNHLKV